MFVSEQKEYSVQWHFNQHPDFTYQNIKRYKIISVIYIGRLEANFQFQVKKT